MHLRATILTKIIFKSGRFPFNKARKETSKTSICHCERKQMEDM